MKAHTFYVVGVVRKKLKGMSSLEKPPPTPASGG
jgi:hypothetical protein